MMHPYTHNPEIYRRHFRGKALPHFKGQRIQHGRGILSFVRRVASPLMGAVAPHLAGAASKLARKAVKAAFPNHPLMQRVVGNVVKAGTRAVVKTVQKGPPSAKKRRIAKKRPKKKLKRNKRNIFNE